MDSMDRGLFDRPVVSQCPICGAPIYGDERWTAFLEPTIRYSCECRTAALASMGTNDMESDLTELLNLLRMHNEGG